MNTWKLLLGSFLLMGELQRSKWLSYETIIVIIRSDTKMGNNFTLGFKRITDISVVITLQTNVMNLKYLVIPKYFEYCHYFHTQTNIITGDIRTDMRNCSHHATVIYTFRVQVRKPFKLSITTNYDIIADNLAISFNNRNWRDWFGCECTHIICKHSQPILVEKRSKRISQATACNPYYRSVPQNGFTIYHSNYWSFVS